MSDEELPEESLIPSPPRPVGGIKRSESGPYKRHAEAIRRFLERKPKGPGAKSTIDRQIETLVGISLNPKSPFCIQATQALWDRAYGKVKPSEEELEALKGGLKMVFVQRPEVPVVEEKALEPPKPEFIDAEVIEEG